MIFSARENDRESERERHRDSERERVSEKGFLWIGKGRRQSTKDDHTESEKRKDYW